MPAAASHADGSRLELCYSLQHAPIAPCPAPQYRYCRRRQTCRGSSVSLKLVLLFQDEGNPEGVRAVRQLGHDNPIVQC